MKFSVPCVAVVVSASLCFAFPAQENREVCSVALSVKDQSGAVVPNAHVRIVPLPSGAEKSLKTDIDGKLTFDLPSGSYNLTVESPGFRRVTNYIDAKTSSHQEIEVVLPVGEGGNCPVCENPEMYSLKPLLPPIESHLYQDDENAQARPTRALLEILTPHEGVDFTRYTTDLLRAVKRNWSVPDEAKDKTGIEGSGAKGRVSVIFKIRKNGRLDHKPTVEISSGKKPLDDATVAAIRASAPFKHLPESFSGPYVELRINFLYNLSLSALNP